MTVTEDFDKAMQNVTQDRGTIYGHPADSFARIAQIKDAVKACGDPRILHCLEMTAVKMDRLVMSPYHLDSIIDIGGYARCMAMIIDRRFLDSAVKETP